MTTLCLKKKHNFMKKKHNFMKKKHNFMKKNLLFLVQGISVSYFMRRENITARFQFLEVQDVCDCI